MIKLNLKKLIKFRKNNTITTIGPVEVTGLSGILVTGDGKRIRGNVLGPCIVVFPQSVKFIPISENDDCRGME